MMAVLFGVGLASIAALIFWALLREPAGSHPPELTVAQLLARHAVEQRLRQHSDPVTARPGERGRHWVGVQ
ncbi:hypothetical protein GFY24_00805 [Nocardia sp. SYP-A9097]|uniref:hypothetical protein n=1 Tax=Nocardia sp. SYP-A9097 TaxID=2663237 RepID=UPI00129B1148|nr:hypothetical protein [Nocardia sp. SYP-A9097]MRH86017.1 hypothetical protein [Nocardia sp. SYP-A9097]